MKNRTDMLHTLENVYNELIKYRKGGYDDIFHLGRILGYLECVLSTIGELETWVEDGTQKILLKKVKSNSWWKSDKLESIEDALVRMTKKCLNER